MKNNRFFKGGILVAIATLLVIPALVLAQSALTANITSPANNAEVEVGKSVSFSGTATGGTAPYTYRWTFSNDSSEIAGQNVSKTFDQVGNVTVSFRVTDKNLNTNTKNITIKVVEEKTDALAISDIKVTNITQNSATITWKTNKPADSRVIYDTTSRPSIEGASAPNYGYANSTQTFNGTNWVTEHSVNVTGLSPNTKYFFRVISTRS